MLSCVFSDRFVQGPTHWCSHVVWKRLHRGTERLASFKVLLTFLMGPSVVSLVCFLCAAQFHMHISALASDAPVLPAHSRFRFATLQLWKEASRIFPCIVRLHIAFVWTDFLFVCTEVFFVVFKAPSQTFGAPVKPLHSLQSICFVKSRLYVWAVLSSIPFFPL